MLAKMSPRVQPMEHDPESPAPDSDAPRPSSGTQQPFGDTMDEQLRADSSAQGR